MHSIFGVYRGSMTGTSELRMSTHADCFIGFHQGPYVNPHRLLLLH